MDRKAGVSRCCNTHRKCVQDLKAEGQTGSHVQYDGTTDKYNGREKTKKCSCEDPRGRIKPPITPVSKRRACVFCYNPEKGAQTVLRSIFSNSCDVCIIKLQPLSFFLFSFFQLFKCVDCDMSRRTNEQQHIRGDTRKVSEDKRRHTHSHNHWGGKEREKSHSRMREDTSSLHQGFWDCDILNGEVE